TKDQAIFSNDVVTISADLTGVQPWIVKWSDGLTQPATNSPIQRMVSGTNVAALGGSFIYSITNLSDANCTAISSSLTGGAEIVVIPSSQHATASGSTNICSGDCATITATVTEWTNGINTKTYGSPWTVTWSDGVTQTITSSGSVGVTNRIV